MSTFNVVLVEDEKPTVELLREALTEARQDLKLVVFPRGEEALEYLYETSDFPHLLLLDLNLPGKHGLEILREIKQSDVLKALPVIVLTNSRSPDDVMKAYAAQCNAYIRKPMGFDSLVEVIEGTGKFWFEIADLPDGH